VLATTSHALVGRHVVLKKVLVAALKMGFQPALQSFAFVDGDAQAALVVKQLVEAGGAYTHSLSRASVGRIVFRPMAVKISRRRFLGSIAISEKNRAVLENLSGAFDLYTGLWCETE
jgi:hypothetical protein